MKKIDMTHGPIGRKTIRFALLLALTGMLQQVFNTIYVVFSVVSIIASWLLLSYVEKPEVRMNLLRN